MEANLWMIPAAGALALVFAYVKSAWINKQSAGNETMSTIANNIREGAMAFLSAEYKKLAIFVAVVAVLLAYANNGRTDSHALIAVAFIVVQSVRVWRDSSVCALRPQRTSGRRMRRKMAAPALDVAFSGGAVMGMSVVGLALVGLGGLFLLLAVQTLSAAAWRMLRA